MKISKEKDILMKEYESIVRLKRYIDDMFLFDYDLLFLTYKRLVPGYHFKIYFRKPEKIGWKKIEFDLKGLELTNHMLEYIMNRGLCLCCSTFNNEFIAFNDMLIEEITKPYYVKFQTETQDEWYIPLSIFKEERKYNVCKKSRNQLTFF